MTLREFITKIGFEVDEQSADNAENRVRRMSTGMKTVIGGAIAGIVAIGVSAISAAGDMEMMTTQFEVMLGSAEAAVVMMDDLKTFAASTPFALEDLATGTQQLLSFGVASADVVETMKLLGDTAGGDAEKLSGLVLAYGKVTTKGKASLEEINMMAERGIPIFDVLSKQMGTSKAELFKLISAGKVSAADITQSFRTMTSEGGMFFEGMKKQSLTFQGLVSTMKDNVKLMVASIGETLLPVAKEVINTITELVQGPLGDLTKSLVGALAPVIASIAGLLENVINAIMPLSTILKAIIPLFTTALGILDALGPILDIISFALTAVGDMLMILGPPLNDVIALVVELMNTLLEMISIQLLAMLTPLTGILIDITTIIADMLTLLMPLFRIAAKFFAMKFAVQLKLVLAPLKVMMALLSVLTGILSKLIVLLSAKLLPIFKQLDRAASILMAVFTSLMTLLQGFITSAIADLAELGKQIGIALIGKIGEGITKIKEWATVIKSTVSEAIAFIADIIRAFWDWIFARFPVLETIINKISSVFANVWETIRNTFMVIWDAITGSIQKLIGWVEKIPGVDLKIPKLEGGGDGSTDATNESLSSLLTSGLTPGFNPAVTAAGNTANIDMQNNITISAPEGVNTEGLKGVVEDAARAVFTIELQKVLVDAGY